jgi:hydroxyethylthiazole kinase
MQLTLIKHISDILTQLRVQNPMVHILTNPVAQVISANALLALGAQPSMTQNIEETPEFLKKSASALINLGMMTGERRAILEACLPHVKRWVLDPVKVNLSCHRLAFAQTLINARPDVIKLNADEATALFKTDQQRKFSYDHSLVTALTGSEDVITDGTRTNYIRNGHSMMTQTTAIGCTAGAIIAACLAVENDAYVATMAGLLIVGIAGERAAQVANGAGTFPAAFIDALSHLSPDLIMQNAKTS